LHQLLFFPIKKKAKPSHRGENNLTDFKSQYELHMTNTLNSLWEILK